MTIGEVRESKRNLKIEEEKKTLAKIWRINKKLRIFAPRFRKKNDSEIFEEITYITPVVQDEEETVETKVQ